jgi:uncharacterized protein (UPF0332 family)
MTTGDEQKKHNGNIGKFREIFIKPGKLPSLLSDHIRELYKYRDLGDYDLDFLPDKAIVEGLLFKATEFVDIVEKYINVSIE